MKVEMLRKIDFFTEQITTFVELSLPAKYRRINVQLTTNLMYSNTHGVTFRILYFPTGCSFADRPKKLPDGVLEKLKTRIRNKLNGKFFNASEFDKLTMQNIELTFFHLYSLKLTKTHRRKIGAHIERPEIKDFFEY